VIECEIETNNQLLAIDIDFYDVTLVQVYNCKIKNNERHIKEIPMHTDRIIGSNSYSKSTSSVTIKLKSAKLGSRYKIKKGEGESEDTELFKFPF
jgi:hypothetical protein